MEKPDTLCEQGTVLTVEGSLATVRVARGGSCGASCPGCLVSLEGDRKTVLVQAVNRAKAREGDQVRLALGPGRLVGMAALAYLLPLVFLFFGAFAGPWLGAALGLSLSIDLARALASLLGLAVGLSAIKLVFSRVKPSGSFTPVIVEILQ